MEKLNTNDFFNGLISQSVEKGDIQVWGSHGTIAAQPYQKTKVIPEEQPVTCILESEDGQKFFVVMSKDGQRCSVSNDQLMAYELFWTADKSTISDYVSLTPNTNLSTWQPPTGQMLEGTIGFCRDKNCGSKYVTTATDGTKPLPEENFSQSLEEILQELQDKKEKVTSMRGREDSKKCLTSIYENSIKNIISLRSISEQILRAYEEGEIKENMALKAKLTEQLKSIESKIQKLQGNLKNKENIYDKLELEDVISDKEKKLAEYNSIFDNEK